MHGAGKVEAHAIRNECIALSNAFAYHLDRREYEELADLFVPLGVWRRHGIDLRGRDAIVFALGERPSNQFTRHLTVGHHFTEISGERAASTAYNVSYFAFEESGPPFRSKPGDTLVFDFVDEFVNTENGWRFSSRASRPLFVADSLWTLFEGVS